MIPFSIPKIDSLTLLIPTDKIKIVSPTFLQRYSKIYTTGEIEESEDFYNWYQKTDNEDSCTFLKYKVVTRKFGDQVEEILQLMITSKLLLSHYFEGINKGNISTIHDYIIKDGIIDISLEELLNVRVTDIDICKDFPLNLEEFQDLKTILSNNIIPTKANVLQQKSSNAANGNWGLQFNERHKATPAKPFMKLYHKTSELLCDKTYPFTKTNLKDYMSVIDAGIGRVEVTIKNQKQKARHGMEDTSTLKELLSFKESQLNNTFNKAVSEYFTKIEAKIKNRLLMKPTDMMLIAFLERIIHDNKNISMEELLFISTKYVDDKYKRHAIKKKLLELIARTESTKKLEGNSDRYKKPITVLKQIGLFKD